MTDKEDYEMYMRILNRATAYAGNEPQWALVWLFIQLLNALSETNEHLGHLAATYAEREPE